MSPSRVAQMVVLAAAGFVGLAPARDAAPAVPPAAFEVERVSNLAYLTHDDADPFRHKLDLYVPKGAKDFPVLVFVHGGGWTSGGKNLYVALGKAFARFGIGTAVINYRLAPKVKHPGHVQDVAAAFAWVRAHAAEYGGDPARITLMGHSAGGHLVTLLATDPTYLKAEKLSPADIRSVVAVSGAYRVYPDGHLYTPAFGTDPEACRLASPLTHVAGSHPPFLIAYAGKELEDFDQMALDLHAALGKGKSPAALLKLPDRTHITIITHVVADDDALNRAVRAFVLK